jgi:hypothetical protein
VSSQLNVNQPFNQERANKDVRLSVNKFIANIL